eukprot:scaffold5745_cov79-Cylindrotheca_fusiformis.AAC.1
MSPNHLKRSRRVNAVVVVDEEEALANLIDPLIHKPELLQQDQEEEEEDNSTNTSLTSESEIVTPTTSPTPTSERDGTTTTTNNNKKNKKNQQKGDHVATRVRFSQITIREYPIIIGDNPSVMMGVPITIDWEVLEELIVSVDEYEASKPTPRTMVELRIPSNHRDAMLKQLGFSLADRNRGRKAANIAKYRRKRTSDTEQLASTVEAMERLKRATLNATLFRKRKNQERAFLQPYRQQSGTTTTTTKASADPL